ncbi:hypothetical protein RhiirB3_494633, partial [Rhizophagus irregularis]
LEKQFRRHPYPWCQVSKYDQGNNWKISKKMENIHEYPGHNRKPLFYMIPLDKWVPDELHILLRIWDRLWYLVLSELKEFNQFDDICRDEIVKEMDRIGVNFQFWQEKSNTWNHTSLMGDDKKKVLKNFNFKRILPPSRAKAIQELWDRFHQVYLNLKLKDYDAQQFRFEAEDWLELFKVLYMPSDITPYMHVLVCHMSEFMEKHKQFGIKAFSCAAVEKKNHQQDDETTLSVRVIGLYIIICPNYKQRMVCSSGPLEYRSETLDLEMVNLHRAFASAPSVMVTGVQARRNGETLNPTNISIQLLDEEDGTFVLKITKGGKLGKVNMVEIFWTSLKQIIGIGILNFKEYEMKNLAGELFENQEMKILDRLS